MRHLLEFRKELKPEQRTAFLNLVQTRLDKVALRPHGRPARRPLARPVRAMAPPGPGMGPGPGPGMPGPGMEPGPGPEGPGRPD